MYGQLRNGANVLARAARAATGLQVASGPGWAQALLPSCEGALVGPSYGLLPLGHESTATSEVGGSWRHMSPAVHHQQVASFASKGGGKGGKAGGGKGGARSGGGKAEEAAGEEVVFDMTPFTEHMSRAVDHLRRDLAGIRTGTASPGLLENVVVGECSHGQHVPLRALGTVVARNPQLLVVEVYDKQDADPVVEAIQKSALGLQARSEAGEVLVPVPRPTMEMVERMVKLAKQEAEHVKVEVRKARHGAMEAARRWSRSGGVSQDEGRRKEAEVQATTDRFIAEVDALLKAKVSDLRQNH